MVRDLLPPRFDLLDGIYEDGPHVVSLGKVDNGIHEILHEIGFVYDPETPLLREEIEFVLPFFYLRGAPVPAFYISLEQIEIAVLADHLAAENIKQLECDPLPGLLVGKEEERLLLFVGNHVEE